MNFQSLPDAAARQFIDADHLFAEFRRVRAEARPYAAGMYWKQERNYEYLIKTFAAGRTKRLGRRSAETELIFERFHERKREVEARLKSLTEAMGETERLNKALRVGRCPAIVIDLLNAIEDAGLADHFVVVGTHALYAYEAAAGVRIIPAALATRDVDFLWDARKRVQFAASLGNGSILKILQRVDPSFRSQGATAINDKGFEVDFLRQIGDPHPFHFSGDEDDLWPIQADQGGVMTRGAKFEHSVVSATGRMAMMRTIAPDVFVKVKRALARRPDREAVKRHRDARQADIVEAITP